MNNGGKLAIFIMMTTLLCLAWSANIQAKDDASACVCIVSFVNYGDAFDPLMVNRYTWGTGKFTFSSCYAGVVEIIPNETISDEIEALTIYISRLTPPENCGDG